MYSLAGLKTADMRSRIEDGYVILFWFNLHSENYNLCIIVKFLTVLWCNAPYSYFSIFQPSIYLNLGIRLNF